ncbi:MAG: alkaline phosphatase family protein [Candidatus Baltobacteraceae bacterium]
MSLGLRERARSKTFFGGAALLAVVASLVACGGAGSSSSPVPGQAQSLSRALVQSDGGQVRARAGKIQHIVIIIQENRSFNNLFMGFPGAMTSNTGVQCDGHGNTQHVNVTAVPFEAGFDVGHGLVDFNAAYDGGKSDCFNLERYIPSPVVTPSPGPTATPLASFMYAFVPRKETRQYWAMAKKYTLGDEMFQSNIDASFTAHQYLIAGQAQNSVDIPNMQPWGCDAPTGQMINTITPNRQLGPKQGVCFTYPTIATELDAAHLTWRYYAPATSPLQLGGIWSAFDAISQVRNGPEWATNVISPETNIIHDVQSGTLENVTWVVPDLLNSDHSGNAYQGSNGGPAWVTSVVDAIGKSQFWNSTAIFVVWDDWGGWYDPQSPQYVDFDGLGYRVPLIAISPYARLNHVAHTHYEFGSILKYIESTWRLAPLAASDTRAAPFGKDVFNYKQAPTPFTPFASPDEFERFSHMRPSYKVPDAD